MKSMPHKELESKHELKLMFSFYFKRIVVILIGASIILKINLFSFSIVNYVITVLTYIFINEKPVIPPSLTQQKSRWKLFPKIREAANVTFSVRSSRPQCCVRESNKKSSLFMTNNGYLLFFHDTFASNRKLQRFPIVTAIYWYWPWIFHSKDE